MNVLAIRTIELLAVASWLVGLFLCRRQSRYGLVMGMYIGCSLTWGYDWIMSLPQIWNLSFPPGTLIMTTWFGRDEAMWAPFSYASFYGMTLMYWLKYRLAIDRRFGLWQYALAFPAGFLLNLIVEGSMIQFLGSNHYGLPPSMLIYNLPWLHFLTTGSTFALLGASGKVVLKAFERGGWDDFAVPTNGRQSTAEGRQFTWSAFWVGVITPQGAFFAVVVEAFYLYSHFSIATGRHL